MFIPPDIIREIIKVAPYSLFCLFARTNKQYLQYCKSILSLRVGEWVQIINDIKEYKEMLPNGTIHGIRLKHWGRGEIELYEFGRKMFLMEEKMGQCFNETECIFNPLCGSDRKAFGISFNLNLVVVNRYSPKYGINIYFYSLTKKKAISTRRDLIDSYVIRGLYNGLCNFNLAGHVNDFKDDVYYLDYVGIIGRFSLYQNYINIQVKGSSSYSIFRHHKLDDGDKTELGKFMGECPELRQLFEGWVCPEALPLFFARISPNSGHFNPK